MCLRIHKLFAFVLAVFYFLTQVAMGSAAESNFWAERKNALKNESDSKNTILLAGLPAISPSNPNQILKQLALPTRESLNTSVPPQLKRTLPQNFLTDHAPLIAALSQTYGTVRRVNIPPNNKSGKVVIHIQDVHQNFEAQNNIGNTIQELVNRNAVGLVGLEGAFKPVDLARFRTFPHQDVIRKVSDYLLQENKISGPVHALMTLPRSSSFPTIAGIDDADHYDQNVEAYKHSAPQVDPLKKQLETAERDLAQRKAHTLNPTLMTFDQQVQAYREGRSTLGQHIQALKRQLHDLPTVCETFLKALDMENNLNFSQVEAERSHLLAALLEKLDKNQTARLLNHSLAYRLGSLRQTEFYEYLSDLCTQKGIPLTQFPSMQSYLRYVLLSDRIDSDKLFSEIQAAEQKAYSFLTLNSSERRLVTESRQLYLYGKLLDFALTPEEWKEYKEGRFPSPHGGEGSRERGNPFSFTDFYREAEHRDKLLAENLLHAMDNAKTSTAVLVTGGFHSNGINQAMSKAGITTITFVPKITKVETANGTNYLSVFTQERTPLEKLFQGEKLFLATPPTAAIDDGSHAMLSSILAGKESAWTALAPESNITLQSLSARGNKHTGTIQNPETHQAMKVTIEDAPSKVLSVTYELIQTSLLSLSAAMLTQIVLTRMHLAFSISPWSVFVGLIAFTWFFFRKKGLQLPLVIQELEAELINGVRIKVRALTRRDWFAEPMFMTDQREEDDKEMPIKRLENSQVRMATAVPHVSVTQHKEAIMNWIKQLEKNLQ